MLCYDVTTGIGCQHMVTVVPSGPVVSAWVSLSAVMSASPRPRKRSQGLGSQVPESVTVISRAPLRRRRLCTVTTPGSAVFL